MTPTRPAFHSVIDLGLRDVGASFDARRFAAHFGKGSVPLVALVIVFAFVPCLLLRRVGADVSVVVAFALAWMAATLVLAYRMAARSPVLVVKVTAEGTNHATRLLILPTLTLLPAAFVLGSPALLLLAVPTVLMVVVAWRSRGRVPELLRRFRPLLDPLESVVGDGIGVARGVRRNEVLRLIAATDRRLLMVSSSRSEERFVVLDVPYERLLRFGVEWKYRGRAGELSLTVADADGVPSGTHVVSSIAPANLLSIALALRAHGVDTDDPAGLLEAEQAWDEARRRGRPEGRGHEGGGMGTREFDQGLWLLMALSAALFYANPFGIGLGESKEAAPVLLAVPVVGAVCGYVSRTRSSLLYLVPLNLLVTPAFFFAGAGDVIGVMLALSALATVGLWVGSALARRAATPRPPARSGSLRHALSGPRLVRISGGMLATMLVLAATAGAAGFELTSVRLAVEEMTAQTLPADGRSNLTGGLASLTYTPGAGLRELITDEAPLSGPYDGARWELRSSFTKGYNVLTLGHYVVTPRLADPAAVERFIAEKDRAHTRLAGFRVTHRLRVVDGRTGYIWDHGSRSGSWYFAAWFPQADHSFRVECIARDEASRFKRLCGEAMRSLRFAG